MWHCGLNIHNKFFLNLKLELYDFHLKVLCLQNSFPANGDVDKFRHCINNYNITFDCCLKNIDVAVGGVCNEWCDKW